MSLINQMLRDLEQRRKTADKPIPMSEGQAVFSATGLSSRVIYLAVAGVVLIGVIWAALETIPPLLKGSEQPLPIVVEKELAADEPATIAVTAAVGKAESLNASTGVEENVASPVLPIRKEPVLRKVAVLEDVGTARLLFEFEKRPEYSWKVLGNEAAQLEILFQKTTSSGELTLPAVPGPILQKLTAETSEDGLLLKVEMRPESKFQVFDLPADEFYGERLLLEFSAPVAAKARQQVAAPPEVRPAEPPVAKQKEAAATNKLTKKTIPLSPAEKAVQAYRAGLREMQHNNMPAAEEHFSAALELQPQMLDVRLQLVTLLQQHQRAGEATKLLEDGLRLSPANTLLRKGYARQLMVDGQLRQAIDVLLSSPQPKLGDDFEYHALLAALQQEVGQHRDAIETYQGLLQLRPQEALWWFGLALSLDQSGAAGKARDAYQKAIAQPGLRADLQEYIQNRLQVL